MRLNTTKLRLTKTGFNLPSFSPFLICSYTICGSCWYTESLFNEFSCKNSSFLKFLFHLYQTEWKFHFPKFSLLWVFTLLIFILSCFSCLLPHRSSLTGAGQPGRNSCTYRLQWKRLRFSSQRFPGSASSHATRCKFSVINNLNVFLYLLFIG